MANLGEFINPGIYLILQDIQNRMLFSMNPNIHLLREPFLFTVLKGAIQLGLSSAGHVARIVWSKEMVKHQHVCVPSVLSKQRMPDIKKTRIFATNVGHDVPNLAPVIHKISSSVRGMCGHLLVHRDITS
jgi:hypothetical protein